MPTRDDLDAARDDALDGVAMIPGMDGRREIVEDELVTVITYRDVEVYIRDVPIVGWGVAGR